MILPLLSRQSRNSVTAVKESLRFFLFFSLWMVAFSSFVPPVLRVSNAVGSWESVRLSPPQVGMRPQPGRAPRWMR